MDCKTNNAESENQPLTVVLTSFGYKNGPPPPANLVLDVRFLKNPYWEEELRPLTGMDEAVREYVISQKLAQDVLVTLMQLLEQTLPLMLSVKSDTFTIALGCTGGQHRSTAMVEELSQRLKEAYPDYEISKSHRELAKESACEPTKVGESL